MVTVVISVIIAAAVILIIINEIKKHISGKGSCSCGCNGCTLKDNCCSGKK